MDNRTVPPFFNFLWIMSRGENTADKNELLRRVQQYTSTMELLRKDSPVAHDCRIVTSLDQLVNSLRPIPGYLPVFVLIGHGYAETGGMPMWSDEVLEPNSLLAKWQCSFKCDVIACGCGANVFVSPMQYPILLYYNRQVRFLAAAEPLNETSHVFSDDGGKQRHLELTQLMLHYLRVYDDGGAQSPIKEADAFVKQKRHTAKQWHQEQAKARLEAQVEERVKARAVELEKAGAERDEKRRAQLKEWSADLRQKWQDWGQQKEQCHAHLMRVERWQSRFFAFFCLMLFVQFLMLLAPRQAASSEGSPLVYYLAFDVFFYCLVFRK